MKIFWDTNLFIYLWENGVYAKEMAALERYIHEGQHTLVTSTLTVGEILTQPARHGRKDLRADYLRVFQRLLLVPFDLAAAQRFAELRAHHSALRPPDAIQLSCAAVGGCDLFMTNDNRLARVVVEGIAQVSSLTDWHKDL